MEKRPNIVTPGTPANALSNGPLRQEFERVIVGQCPLCAKPVDKNGFRNEISRKEFSISGMCQACQDRMFGVD